jgi:hypothetical protein
MTRDELRIALRLHKWRLTDRSAGKQANFRGADCPDSIFRRRDSWASY